MSGHTDPPARQRVVLAQRHGARIVRTRVEVQEQTEVGDAMIRGLVRAQLGLAIRLAVVVAGSLCAIPLSTMLFPALSDYSVWGIRLPWLVMGGAVLPLLLITGWVFVRRAERNEQDFTNLVDD
ncbi:hypothetical protein CJ178_26990 [Rhodococcus sp. ACPA4]|uniref:Uncharacterized protein n=2 Tax=Nocardiaceae TaxID=85025 RepID=A0A652YTA1_NOCGL|nr:MULTISPECIES: hypothetical protein [Rhodococcus]NMD61130.1 hypothetical protein [Nocardia globerula]NRI64996.1 hypothetical protein [Rhodococcus sp. MS16]KJF21258.1 hypothetical protein SZ00_04464 [Rhodococcus sp. AD45]MCE4264936.1 hypothetical protein [Rhodococcus globerulus]MDV6266063.1 hypothetical protein [Rhodococcus globerulus]